MPSLLLMENRSHLITALCEILQNRELPFTRRLSRALDFLEILTCEEQPDADRIREAVNASHDCASAVMPEDSADIMCCWLEVFDPVPEALEKPVQGAAELTRMLAGGREGYTRLLADHYAEGAEIFEPFLTENEHLLENFLVHCVFSDSFKQFFRCQNELLTVRDILRHESALLRVWYVIFKVQLAQAALLQGNMNEDLFLQAVIRADRSWWHYPDWFARAADRYIKAFG